MPRQANGTYQAPAGTAAVSGQAISSSDYNTLNTDFGNEITNSLDRGGRGAMTANLPMGGNRIVNMADPAIATDGATKGYVDTTATNTTSAAITALGLGTAATRNTGSTANTVPLLDANGQLLNQRVAASAGWGVVTKSVGVSNESGVFFDASNNAEIGARNGAGALRTRWQSVDPSAHLLDGLPAFVCRAWVNFNGSTGAIRASGNVSSVVRNGTGDYTVNFATAMPGGDYSTLATANRQGGNDGPCVNLHESVSPTTTSVRLKSGTPTIGLYDPPTFCVAIFR